MDRLGLSGRILHLPVQELTREQAARFRVLMLVAANTKVILIDRLFSRLDEISMPFVQEWLDSYAGIIVLFGELPDYHKAVKNNQMIQQSQAKPLFNFIISFSLDGYAKTIC